MLRLQISGQSLTTQTGRSVSSAYCVLYLDNILRHKTLCDETSQPLWLHCIPIQGSPQVFSLECWDWANFDCSDFVGEFSIPWPKLKETKSEQIFFNGDSKLKLEISIVAKNNIPENRFITSAEGLLAQISSITNPAEGTDWMSSAAMLMSLLEHFKDPSNFLKLNEIILASLKILGNSDTLKDLLLSDPVFPQTICKMLSRNDDTFNSAHKLLSQLLSIPSEPNSTPNPGAIQLPDTILNIGKETGFYGIRDLDQVTISNFSKIIDLLVACGRQGTIRKRLFDEGFGTCLMIKISNLPPGDFEYKQALLNAIHFLKEDESVRRGLRGTAVQILNKYRESNAIQLTSEFIDEVVAIGHVASGENEDIVEDQILVKNRRRKTDFQRGQSVSVGTDATGSFGASTQQLQNEDEEWKRELEKEEALKRKLGEKLAIEQTRNYTGPKEGLPQSDFASSERPPRPPLSHESNFDHQPPSLVRSNTSILLGASATGQTKPLEAFRATSARKPGLLRNDTAPPERRAPDAPQQVNTQSEESHARGSDLSRSDSARELSLSHQDSRSSFESDPSLIIDLEAMRVAPQPQIGRGRVNVGRGMPRGGPVVQGRGIGNRGGQQVPALDMSSANVGYGNEEGAQDSNPQSQFQRPPLQHQLSSQALSPRQHQPHSPHSGPQFQSQPPMLRQSYQSNQLSGSPRQQFQSIQPQQRMQNTAQPQFQSQPTQIHNPRGIQPQMHIPLPPRFPTLQPLPQFSALQIQPLQQPSPRQALQHPNIRQSSPRFQTAPQSPQSQSPQSQSLSPSLSPPFHSPRHQHQSQSPPSQSQSPPFLSQSSGQLQIHQRQSQSPPAQPSPQFQSLQPKNIQPLPQTPIPTQPQAPPRPSSTAPGGSPNPNQTNGEDNRNFLRGSSGVVRGRGGKGQSVPNRPSPPLRISADTGLQDLNQPPSPKGPNPLVGLRTSGNIGPGQLNRPPNLARGPNSRSALTSSNSTISDLKMSSGDQKRGTNTSNSDLSSPQIQRSNNQRASEPQEETSPRKTANSPTISTSPRPDTPIFNASQIAPLLEILTLLEGRDDLYEDQIMFIPKMAPTSPGPTEDGANDVLLLTLLTSGYLTPDLVSSLSAEQLYYYAPLLLGYDQKNQKKIMEQLQQRINESQTEIQHIFFLDEVTRWYGEGATQALSKWRFDSRLTTTVAWLNEKLQLKSLPKKIPKDGLVFPTGNILVDPMGKYGRRLSHASGRKWRVINGEIGEVKLVKIFSSNVKPILIQMSSADETQTSQMIWKLDDLRNDYVVQIMFFIFNRLWLVSDLQQKPFVYQYKIVPMGPSCGVIEFVTGCVSTGEYKWKTLSTLSPEEKSTFLCSMAGSYVACWVLGIRDRHQDNMMIKDNHIFIHIDFGFILNDTPGFDAPVFSIPRGVKSSLTNTEWKSFVSLCAQAFAVLHNNSGVILNTCSLLLGRLPDTILAEAKKYLVKSLMISLPSATAQQTIIDLVEKGSSSTQKELKYFMHGAAMSLKT